tara:strand:- start:365 stop:556 length:192 start_codon:yes stop_codon:yes gene_type:complete
MNLETDFVNQTRKDLELSINKFVSLSTQKSDLTAEQKNETKLLVSCVVNLISALIEHRKKVFK